MAIKYNGQPVRKVRYNGKYIKKLNCKGVEETFGSYNETALEDFANKPTITNTIRNANAMVNLHNGNIKIVIPDAVFGNSTFGINVGHIYNAMMEDDAIHEAKWTFMGKGFKINYQQYLLYSPENNTYNYIDEVGAKHEFIKSIDGNTFYDTSGSGKILKINATTLTLADRESNELIFDRTSGFIKKIKNNRGQITDIYYINAKITSIIKSIGSETRTMSFEYDDFDRLVAIKYGGTNDQIIYSYKENTCLLESIKKRISNQEETIVKLEYNDKRQLIQITNTAKQVIKCFYNGVKLLKIQQGIIKSNSFRLLKNQTVTYRDGNTEVVTMIEENLADKIDTANQIRMVYQYNYEGVMLSSYEKHGNNYTSVYPASNFGTRLMRRIDDVSFPNFNGVAINNFGKDEEEEQNVHEKSNGKSGDKSNNIGALVDLINETSEVARAYTFSFWYQMPTCFTSTKSVKLRIYFDENSYIDKEIKIIDENWHYVSFEKYFRKNEEIGKIDMFLVAEKGKDFSAKITDIRAIQNITNTKIKDDNNEVDIRKINKLICNDKLLALSDIRDITNKNQYFISARDIIWNEYEKQKNTGLFYLNNGRTLIEVDYENENPQLFAENIGYAFRTGNYTMPFLFNEIIIDKNTTIKSHSYPSETKEEYEEIIRGYKNSIGTRVFKRYDKCMRIIEEIDEYDVQTKYEYDDFSNIKKTIVKPLHINMPSNTIYCKTKYDSSGNLDLDIHTNSTDTDYHIDGINGNVKSVIDANKKLKIEYTNNGAMGRISTINYLTGSEFANTSKSGVLSYNDKGYLKSFIRSDNQSYDFDYGSHDDEGNLTEYKINNQLMKSKMTRYHSRGVMRQTKYANEAKWHDTYYDIYGRVDVKKEDGNNKYINVFEDKAGFRSSGALLRRAIDNYAETTYSLDYDANENLHRYSYNGRGINGSVEMSDESTVSEHRYIYKQNYDFKVNNKSYKGVYSDDIIVQYDSKKIINPRISCEKSIATSIECEYTYDNLGRIAKITYKSNNSYYNEKNELTYSYRQIDTELGHTTTYDIENIGTSYAFIVHEHGGVAIPPLASYEERGHSFQYDDNHNILKCAVESPNFLNSATHDYKYDAFNRLTREEINRVGFIKSKEYDYDDFGNRKKVTMKQFCVNEGNPDDMDFIEIKDYQYDAIFKDRLKCINDLIDSSKNSFFEYDSIGNPIKYKVGSLSESNNMVWTRGNLLSTYRDKLENVARYYYSIDGTRVEKIIQQGEKTITSKYHLDGSKILGETKIISDNSNDSIVTLQYIYNQTGVIGIMINENVYLYEKDAFGNVVRIHYQSREYGQTQVASYEYDAWGNVSGEIDSSHESLLEHNPFLWKGHYYDCETGFYYINGNYYDPETGRYINCNDLSDIVMNNNKLMESTYCLENCNPIMLCCNIDTNMPNLKLNVEFNYKKKSLGLLILRIVAPLITLASMILIFLFPPAGIIGLVIATLLMIASAVLFEFQMAELREHFTNINVIRQGHNMSRSTYNKIRTGVVVTVMILSIALMLLPRPQCFKKGTLVHGEASTKKIEDIVVGDKVWAFDEKTKTKSLKRVTKIFRNGKSLSDGQNIDADSGTLTWIHVHVGEEKISCTPAHPFFVLNASADTPIVEFEVMSYNTESESAGKWIAAKHLKSGDALLLASGKTAIINTVEVEYLEKLETTYNFEVSMSPSLLSCEKLEKIAAKEENYFNVEGKGKLASKDIQVGDKIILESGEIVTVLSAESKTTGGPECTYNLEVEDFHTYFVGEHGVLCHNMCGGDLIDDVANNSLNSFDDIVNNPQALWGKSADEVGGILGDGFTKGTYGSKGLGWKFNDSGGRMIAYQPQGVGRHVAEYYKISSSLGKIKVVGQGYLPAIGDKARIIYMFGGIS